MVQKQGKKKKLVAITTRNKINQKQTNNINNNNNDNKRTTTDGYKNGFHPCFIPSDTIVYISEVHSYSFCTHIYNPKVHFKNKYIYTKKQRKQ